MNISYDSYRVFYYAAKYKSFSQAAAALYNNQPNVTRIIKRLESDRKSTRLNSSHWNKPRMPSSA